MWCYSQEDGIIIQEKIDGEDVKEKEREKELAKKFLNYDQNLTVNRILQKNALFSSLLSISLFFLFLHILTIYWKNNSTKKKKKKNKRIFS